MFSGVLLSDVPHSMTSTSRAMPRATRMPSRASAIRELLERGLAAQGFLKTDGAMKSSGFGVAGKTDNGATRGQR
jgi:hypothetical protein